MGDHSAPPEDRNGYIVACTLLALLLLIVSWATAHLL